MVAVSVGESRSLKLQEPFKQYVKLSKLKIYAPRRPWGLKLLLLFFELVTWRRGLSTRAKQNSKHGYGRTLAKIIAERVAFHKFYCGEIKLSRTGLEGGFYKTKKKDKVGIFSQRCKFTPFCFFFNKTKTFAGGLCSLVKETSLFWHTFRVHDAALRTLLKMRLRTAFWPQSKGATRIRLKTLWQAPGQQLTRITAGYRHQARSLFTAARPQRAGAEVCKWCAPFWLTVIIQRLINKFRQHEANHNFLFIKKKKKCVCTSAFQLEKPQKIKSWRGDFPPILTHTQAGFLHTTEPDWSHLFIVRMTTCDCCLIVSNPPNFQPAVMKTKRGEKNTREEPRAEDGWHF